MDWKEVTENPNLRNLPFKIELNEYGQIVMNPVKLSHSAYQDEISHLLKNINPDGRTLVECAIWTRRGTKVADVAWFSDERWAGQKGNPEASIAPELCVEVASISSSQREMNQKRKLYFEQGAIEFWFCSEYGDITFYNSEGQIKSSILFSEFPNKVEI